MNEPIIRVTVNGCEISPSTPVVSRCPYCDTEHITPVSQESIVCYGCDEEFDIMMEGEGEIEDISMYLVLSEERENDVTTKNEKKDKATW